MIFPRGKGLPKRPNYIMCSINIQPVPEIGKIFYVKDGKEESKEKVLESWNKTLFLREQNTNVRGWTLDILKCVDILKKEVFTLDEVYQFDQLLTEKHPENNNVQAKIRQQLQILRDTGFIEFLGRGRYRKI